MVRRLLSKRLRFRHVAPILASLGLFGSAASCILADPPPALPTVLPQAPLIDPNSAAPPPNQLPTNWLENGTLTFTVPVTVDFAANFYVLVDYLTPVSVYPPGQPTPSSAEPVADGGGVQLITFTLNPPEPANTCHTITFFADLANDPMFSLNKGGLGSSASSATLTYTPGYCTSVTWFYDPTGVANCLKFDAGGIPDAEVFHEGGFGDVMITFRD
jgi:hypothetical protein